MDSVNKLGFAATALAETVLEVREYTVSVKKVDYGTIENVFLKFADNASEGEGPVITEGGHIRLLVNGGNVRHLPVGRYRPGVY